LQFNFYIDIFIIFENGLIIKYRIHYSFEVEIHQTEQPTAIIGQ